MPFTKPPRPAEPLVRHTPSAEERAVWAQGSCTVKQARAEFGLTRGTIRALIKDGTLRVRIRDLAGTYLIARVDLVTYVASLPETLAQAAGTQTNEPEST